jgi:predicted amidohydrolase YtcJ
MSAPAAGPAELLFVNGSLRTMEPARPVASALAVRDGRIVAAGLDAELRPLVAGSTRVVDHHGRTLLPGFQDAHVHPPLGGWAMLTCDLHELPWDREAYLDAVAAYAAAHPDEPWILGAGWGMPGFPGGTPSRRDLDVIVPERPVYENRDGPRRVNSRALSWRASAVTPDPADGRIER